MSTVCWMNTFSAVTYNVLAQSYTRPDRYPLSTSESLDSTRRHARLLARIQELDADLLCVQELEPAVYQDLHTRLDPTHDAAYLRRGRRPEGLAVFARRGRLRWEDWQQLRLQAHRPGDDDMALVVHLTVNERPLYVVCAHLAWQPESTPPAEHVGHRQMLELLAYRDAQAPNATWIFAGDFNATSQSDVVTAALGRGMSDSCRSQRPWDTCAINGRPRKLDYLLYTTGRFTPHPDTLPKLTRDTALPSLAEPSDHLPLRVRFTAAP